MDESLIAYTSMVSVLMPIVVSCVVQSSWRKEVKGIAALAACVLAGAGTVFLAGADLRDLRVVIPTVLIASQASYHAFWKPTGLLPELEKATDAGEVRDRLEQLRSPAAEQDAAGQSRARS